MSQEKGQLQQPGLQQHGDGARIDGQSSRRRCDQCSCSCHDKRRLQTPTILRSAIGQLSLKYSSIPGLTPKCNDAACEQITLPEFQAEAWLRAPGFGSKIVKVGAAYRNFRADLHFHVQTFQRVEDCASVINYTMSGNIEAVDVLFIKGLASATDVSETRGYSLHRVSLLNPNTYPRTQISATR